MIYIKINKITTENILNKMLKRINNLSLDQKNRILRKYISSIDINSIDAEKHAINTLTTTFNEKENEIIVYYDALTKQKIDYEEYERRYYMFVLLKNKC